MSLFLLLVASAFATEFTRINAGRGYQEWKSRIIYQVLTDRFARTDNSNATCDLARNDYCGGTYRGIINHLDYIQNLGVNAIWISPVVENTYGSWHGYHATNFYALNSMFGSESDLKQLVSECHKRDIWVMVDTVFNHVGPVGTDYGRIYPFNQGYHYNDWCGIDYSNQWSIEHCRVADLPDLNQDNEYVRNELISWAQWLVKTYDLDGLRVDTVKHVPTYFWSQLVGSMSNVYLLGEVFDGRVDYLKTYTNVMPGQFSYPMYYTLQNVYAYKQSCYQIRDRLNEYNNYGIDYSLLGGFIDNHDNARWLNINGQWASLKNALAFNLLTTSIPVLYYGTEQGYAGANDPYNREAMWHSGFNQNHELYRFVQTCVAARKKMGTYDQHVERYVDDNFYAFSRGQVLVCTTNLGDGAYVQRQVTYLPFSNGQTVRELFSGQTQTVSNGLNIQLQNGRPQIWVAA